MKAPRLSQQLWDLYYTTNNLEATEKIKNILNRIRREKLKAKKTK